MATTKNVTASTSNETVTDTAFPILDSEPEFKRAKGRAKTALRVAMEQLPVGKSLIAATESNEKLLNSTRQKAQEIRSAGKAEGLDIRFGVRVDIENRIIVTRKP
jgi:hypothetical protein